MSTQDDGLRDADDEQYLDPALEDEVTDGVLEGDDEPSDDELSGDGLGGDELRDEATDEDDLDEDDQDEENAADPGA